MFRAVTSLILVFLMVFAFSGYLGVFKLRQHQIRKEVKTMLKEGAPDSLKFDFYLDVLESAEVTWMHSKEFRYQGDMYDVLIRTKENGRVVLHCVKDVKESGLFAELDRIVSLQTEGKANKNNERNHWQRILTAPFLAFTTSTVIVLLNEKTSHVTPYKMNYHQIFLSPFSPPPRILA